MRLVLRRRLVHEQVLEKPRPIEQWGASTGACLPSAASRYEVGTPAMCPRPASFPAGWLMADPPLHLFLSSRGFSHQSHPISVVLGSHLRLPCARHYHRPCRFLPRLGKERGLSADCLLDAILHACVVCSWAAYGGVSRFFSNDYSITQSTQYIGT